MIRVACCVALAALAATSAAASVKHAACPSGAHASSLPRWKTGGSLRDASIHYAPNAPVYCGFFLVVGRYAYPIENGIANRDVLGKDWVADEPTVDAVLDLGTGHEVFVAASWSGAANLFVGLYTVDAGRLVRLPIGAQQELSLYGSLGTGSLGVACNRHGSLTTYFSRPTAGGKRSTVVTTAYRLRGDRFVRVSTGSTSQPTRELDKRLAAVSREQFAGCAVAHSPEFH